MSKQNVHILLPVLALIFACVGIAKPQWPLVAVSCILIAIDLLVN